jgi:hypothetical protein
MPPIGAAAVALLDLVQNKWRVCTSIFLRSPNMKPHTAILLGLCVSVLSSTAISQELDDGMKQDWKILAPGEYHDGEAPKVPGIGWLALQMRDGRWQLVPTELKSERVKDLLLDEGEQKTGIKITSLHKDAIAYLRLPTITPGVVNAASVWFKKDAPHNIAAKQKPLRINFNRQRYELAATSSYAYIKNGTQSTLLEEFRAGEGGELNKLELVWAGDLDRDGKLDLITSKSGYNTGALCLHLSSKAPENHVVTLVDCHSGTGC